MTGYRSGFVAFLGHPNAGKSTLANALVGGRIAAVSGLPQTTRDRIHGILSDDEGQIIFVDLPGLVSPNDRLNTVLHQRVLDTLADVDVVLHLIDVTENEPYAGDMGTLVEAAARPVVAAVTKLDLKPRDFDWRAWLESRAGYPARRYHAMHGIAATKDFGLRDLLATLRGLLPEGPALYDPEALTDRSMRFLAAELLREKVFLNLHQEVPYATAVTIDTFEERAAGKWFIAATIHVERDSQKGILIGKGGAMLRTISSAARLDIEELADHPVFLEVRVKVAANWRRDDAWLRRFGYDPVPEGKKKRR